MRCQEQRGRVDRDRESRKGSDRVGNKAKADARPTFPVVVLEFTAAGLYLDLIGPVGS